MSRERGANRCDRSACRQHPVVGVRARKSPWTRLVVSIPIPPKINIGEICAILAKLTSCTETLQLHQFSGCLSSRRYGSSKAPVYRFSLSLDSLIAGIRLSQASSTTRQLTTTFRKKATTITSLFNAKDSYFEDELKFTQAMIGQLNLLKLLPSRVDRQN